MEAGNKKAAHCEVGGFLFTTEKPDYLILVSL
jgi:hypothetical protein